MTESFPVSWLFTSGCQSIGASASVSVLPMNIQSWFPLGLTDFDHLAFQGNLKSLLQHQNLKASILWCSASFIVQLSHPYMTTGNKHSFDSTDLVNKVRSPLFNMLSSFIIGFLPRSKLHACSHCPQWFWNFLKWDLLLFPLFPHPFARKWWDWMP